MTDTATPANPTDAELLAAVDRGITAGSIVRFEDIDWAAFLGDDEPVEAEIVSDRCELAYERYCTGTGTLVEDPYEADVNNTTGQMIVACDACLRELSNDI